jgi:hypothetical protein
MAAFLGALLMLVASLARPALGDPVPPDEGFGVTAGGDGGEVYRVTSLADTLPPGPGTLRDAVSRPHRRIVFDVAGEIRLVDYLFIRQPYLTIDGLSAPAPGITLRDFGVVIRGIRDVRDPSDAHEPATAPSTSRTRTT